MDNIELFIDINMLIRVIASGEAGFLPVDEFWTVFHKWVNPALINNRRTASPQTYTQRPTCNIYRRLSLSNTASPAYQRASAVASENAMRTACPSS